jgi:hypothetical protein
MNPDGMVALLDYREDGTTRESILEFKLLHPLIGLRYSLPHLLEARSQASQVVIVSFSAVFFPPFLFFGGLL